MGKTPRINNAPNAFGHSFWKTTKPPAGDYEPEDDHGAVYYGQKVVDVHFNEVGDTTLSHKLINEFGYLYNLRKNSYLEEGSIAACFELNGQLYTWNVGPQKEEEIFIAGHRYYEKEIKNEAGEVVDIIKGNVSRLHPESGKTIWTVDLGTVDLNFPTVTVTLPRRPVASVIDAKGNIYIGWDIHRDDHSIRLHSTPWGIANSPIGGVTKLSKSGDIIWTTTLPESSATDDNVPYMFNFLQMDTDSSGYIYISGVSDRYGNIFYKLDPNEGGIVKSFNESMLEMDNFYAPYPTGCQSLVIDHEDNIWFGTLRKYPNTKLDPEGNFLWRMFQNFDPYNDEELEGPHDFLSHVRLARPHDRRTNTRASYLHFATRAWRDDKNTLESSMPLIGQLTSHTPTKNDFIGEKIAQYEGNTGAGSNWKYNDNLIGYIYLPLIDSGLDLYVTENGVGVYTVGSTAFKIYDYENDDAIASPRLFIRGSQFIARSNGYDSAEFGNDLLTPGKFRQPITSVVAGDHLWVSSPNYDFERTYFSNLLRCNLNDGSIVEEFLIGDVPNSNERNYVFHLNSRIISK